MSFFGGFTLGILNGRRHRGSGGGGGGGFTPMALGQNLSFYAYYTYQHLLTDISRGEGVYVVSSTTISTTGNTHSNTTLDSLASTTGIEVGMAVNGTGIPGGTFVVSIAGTTVTMSNAATATATGVTVGFTWNGRPLPYADYDSNGNPNALPTNATGIQLYLQPTEVSEAYNMTWSGSAGTITPTLCTGVGTQGANSLTFTPQTINHVKTVTSAACQVSILSPLPTNIQIRPASDPGTTASASVMTKLDQLNSSTAPIRFMHVTSVEQNLHVNSANLHTGAGGIKFPQNGDGQLGENLLTATDRNQPGALNWWQRRDGMPHETQIAIATAAGRDAWVCINWNYDGTDSLGNFTSSTYLNAIAALWASFAQTTGHKVYVELANEVWNSGTYSVGTQCFNEATALGITAQQRYAQKYVQMIAAFESAFATAGVSNKLVRLLMWQNASGLDTSLGSMVSFAGVSGHVDAIGCAIYYSSTGFANTYTGATAPVIASMYGEIDGIWAIPLLAKKNVADPNGLKMAFYEGGRGDVFNDATFLKSLNYDTGGYNVQCYWLNELRRQFPGCVCCYHDFIDALQAGNNAGSYPLLEDATQPIDATNPKSQAVADTLAGNFTMLDVRVASSSSIYANAPAGTTVATLNGFLPEATLSINDLSGWFTVDPSGNLKATGTAMSAGTHNIDIIQTPNAGVTVLNGPTKTTTLSLTILPALPQDNFNDTTMDATVWQKDTTILAGAHGVAITGVSTSESGGSLSITSSSSTSAQQNGYTLLNNVDITQLSKHYCKISSVSNTTQECYPLIFGVSGGAIVRPRITATGLALDTYNAAGTGSFTLATASWNFTTSPWLRFRYDPTQGTSNGATVSTMTHSTTTATVTTSLAHNMTTGNSVTVTGATPSAYNGTFTITVTGSTTFTYTMLSDPGANASVVGTYTFTPSGTFFFDTALSTASNPPLESEWSVTSAHIARPFFIPTTGLMAFLKNGTSGTFSIDCFNTASG